MWKLPSTRRADIQSLFDTFAAGSSSLSVSGLLRFLHEQQLELSANEEQAEALIDLYEINESANRSMSFEGFLRFMESKHCSIFNQAHTQVYQDMNQPLTSYFISSSHNTYLTGDQLVGQSDLNAYVNALRKGCRCLEIDCWDGPEQEPVVYHGYTLTTKILFKDVISTIEQHAFEVSAYPVILSLENHCSKKQQEVMASYLVSILGEKLLSSPLNHPTTGELPSPDDLKYKILIKNKKLIRREGATVTDTEDSAEEEEEDEDEDELDSDEEEESKKLKNKIKFWSPKSTQKEPKKKKTVVAEALSDLVIYTSSVKFINFSHSRDNQNSYENTSLSEKKARKLVKSAGAEFVRHNQRFLSRIYPAGSRTDSSNYNPQKFWNVGAQLVALNFQSFDRAMDLNDGRFQDNGGCGYILKPDVLMSMSMRCFDPGWRRHSITPRSVMIKVISGSNLPVAGGKPVDPYVQVEIHGPTCDARKEKTQTIKNNSLNPYWGADMRFTITIPELCLVRFCVRSRTGLFSSEFVGQYTLPFLSTKKGYRWVPLRAQDGCSLDPASLFVNVQYT